MKKSNLFYTGAYKKVEKKIEALLNNQKDYLSTRSINSPRAVGDAVEGVLFDNFKTVLGPIVKEYSTAFARRSMADLAFSDKDGFYYVVDVKTHRLDTSFNMPNLTSVERLARFYEDDANYFTILKINYRPEGTKAVVKKVTFVPIEFLSWNCLTLGALGWGQIQIANANTVEIIPQNSRKQWMIDLCDNLLEFYPKEIEKIGNRIDHFKKVKEFWQKKKE